LAGARPLSGLFLEGEEKRDLDALPALYSDEIQLRSPFAKV
jgi:hypothetical protein